MKKNINQKIVIAALAVMMLTTAACSPGGETAQSAPAVDTAQMQSEAAAPQDVSTADAQPQVAAEIDTSSGLSDAEIAGLLFMREEEKLAGDVYRYLYERWGSPVFANIAEGEDAHTESVLALLNAYGIDDPAKAEAGQFSDPDLQALYGQLTVEGSQSLADAYSVGAAIEEIDILDLDGHLAETSRPDIILVYENLKAGSENHLRAFVRVFQNQMREDYSPQYMDQEQYNAIMQAENSAGNGIGGQGFGQGNGQGKP